MKICANKKAYFEYEVLEKHVAGIKLKGSEVKSIRNGKISINESYCFIDNNFEIFLRGSNIALHKEGGIHNNHVTVRDRKLLMKKKEIIKLSENINQKGLTIVPLSVFISDIGLIKIEIGLCRGKNTHDKRNSIKEKDIKRDLERNL